MNRKVQKQETYEKILRSALLVFSEHQYNKASINMICTQANLSKGIVYHHFKDKDELYLVCLQKSIDDVEAYLRSHIILSGDLEADIEQYFTVRSKYFHENTTLSGVYLNALTQLPHHLKDKFDTMNQTVVAFNKGLMKEMLSGVKLHTLINLDDAMEYMEVLIQSMNQEPLEHSTTIEEKEERMKRMILIMLYGIIRR